MKIGETNKKFFKNFCAGERSPIKTYCLCLLILISNSSSNLLHGLICFTVISTGRTQPIMCVKVQRIITQSIFVRPLHCQHTIVFFHPLSPFRGHHTGCCKSSHRKQTNNQCQHQHNCKQFFQNIAPRNLVAKLRVNWLVNDTIISKVFKEIKSY